MLKARRKRKAAPQRILPSSKAGLEREIAATSEYVSALPISEGLLVVPGRAEPWCSPLM